MAGAIYHQKYGEFPDSGFPCHAGPADRKTRVVDRYPKFAKKKQESDESKEKAGA